MAPNARSDRSSESWIRPRFERGGRHQGSVSALAEPRYRVRRRAPRNPCRSPRRAASDRARGRPSAGARWRAPIRHSELSVAVLRTWESPSDRSHGRFVPASSVNGIDRRPFTRRPGACDWMSGSLMLIPEIRSHPGRWPRRGVLPLLRGTRSVSATSTCRLGHQYRPEVTIVHHGGNEASDTRHVAQLAYARRLYMRKHFSLSRQAGGTVAQALGYALRSVLERLEHGWVAGGTGSRARRPGDHARSPCRTLSPRCTTLRVRPRRPHRLAKLGAWANGGGWRSWRH